MKPKPVAVFWRGAINSLRALAFSLAVLMLSVNFANAADETIQPKLDWAMGHPDQVTPDFLRKPENADLLNELRKRALSRTDPRVVVLLLNLGDPDVTRDCVSRYQAGEGGFSPMRELMKSNNPDIILLIGDNLNRNEGVDDFINQGDVFLHPLSVSASEIISIIIIHSSAFSPAVETWATNLRSSPPPATLNQDQQQEEQFRQQMRLWWNQNKTLLMSKKYNEVTPPHLWNRKP